MEKDVKQKFIKLIISFTMFALLAFCLGSITVAWYSHNRKVGSNGIAISAKENDIECAFTVYAYDLSKQKATSTRLVKGTSGDVVVDNTLANFDLNTHDAIFKELNQYTTVLIQVDIYGKKINQNSSGTIRAEIKRDRAASTSTKLEEYVSNILTFRMGKSEAIRSLGDDTNAKWLKAKELMTTNAFTTGSELISYNSSTSKYTVSESINIDLGYVSSDRYTTSDGNMISMFLTIDYSEFFTLKMLDQLNVSGDGTNISSIIPIADDLEHIWLSFVD